MAISSDEKIQKEEKLNDYIQALRQAEERTRLIINLAYDAFVGMDEMGLITDWNLHAEKIFGWTQKEILGRPLAETIIPSRYREAHHRGLKHFLATGQGPVLNKRIEIAALHKEGYELPVELTISPISFDKRILFTAFIRDLSVQKEVENKLADVEQRFQLFVQGVKDYAIFMLDPEGLITTWNKGAERIKGYQREEVLGRHFSIFYTRDAIEQNHPEEALKLAAEHGQFEEVGLRVRKDGSTFWAHVLITVIRDSTGTLKGFSKVSRDITAQKEAEEKLRQAHDRLEIRVQERTVELESLNEELKRRSDELTRSNVELGRFAYIASHDLQEPIRMVMTYSEWLSSKYAGLLDDEGKEFLNFILSGASRMNELIKSLLDYSRSGGRGQRESFDCHQLVQEVLLQLKVAIDEARATVRVDSLPRVHGDRIQLGQVFQNLIANALKFRTNERPPLICVSSILNEAHQWEISVSDNGIGVDMKYAQKIFDIFQRVHDREKYPGTGVGLAICKLIVENHKGTIWVNSKPGEGAQFTFTLPNNGVP